MTDSITLTELEQPERVGARRAGLGAGPVSGELKEQVLGLDAGEPAVELGALPRQPRIHTVQTTSAHPLERAYARVRAKLPPVARQEDIDSALRSAAANRSGYMWPWERTPHSIATGILDDETYDWRAVVGAMLSTGGQPLVVTEERFAEANKLGEPPGTRWMRPVPPGLRA